MTGQARIDVSVDGVTFTRSESDAAKRGAARRTHLGWDDVTGASVRTTRKGRPVIQVGVVGGSTAQDHRTDPFAVKLRRKQSQDADRLVAQIEDEVAGRRRWQRPAPLEPSDVVQQVDALGTDGLTSTST